jgi:hypothetical protein
LKIVDEKFSLAFDYHKDLVLCLFDALMHESMSRALFANGAFLPRCELGNHHSLLINLTLSGSRHDYPMSADKLIQLLELVVMKF